MASPEPSIWSSTRSSSRASLLKQFSALPEVFDRFLQPSLVLRFRRISLAFFSPVVRATAASFSAAFWRLLRVQNSLHACVFATHMRGLPLGIILRRSGGIFKAFLLLFWSFQPAVRTVSGRDSTSNLVFLPPIPSPTLEPCLSSLSAPFSTRGHLFSAFLLPVLTPLTRIHLQALFEPITSTLSLHGGYPVSTDLFRLLWSQLSDLEDEGDFYIPLFWSSRLCGELYGEACTWLGYCYASRY